MNRVLVITTEPDPHIAMLQIHMPEVRFIVIDPKRFPNISMSFLTTTHGSRVLLEGEDITDIKVVWFRKPDFWEQAQMPVPAGYQETVHESYVAFIKWVYAIFPNALWISDPWKIFKGNSKIYQMQLAQELGFVIPPTLITSDKESARKFVETYEHVVVKPLVCASIFEDEVYKTMYTARVDRTTVRYEGLNLSPMIFQQEIVGTDIRVTVVGNKVFACRIKKTGGIAGDVDWRKHQLGEELVYEVDVNFPDDLAQLCVRMVQEMGLQFGAVDFMELEGIYYFLEINPNGQWGFVELKCGLQISKEIAALMQTAL